MSRITVKVSPLGTKIWYRDGVVHRDDGPAIVSYDGAESWYQNGLRHRRGAPAITEPDGTKEWWRHGKLISYYLPRPWCYWLAVGRCSV